jgi:hypothetical protein
MTRISENHKQKIHVKKGKVYDSVQEGDPESNRMIGNLFVAEYQIRRLSDRLTDSGMTTRTLDILLGHSQPRDKSEFTFKCKANGKIYTVSINIHRIRRGDYCNEQDNDDDYNYAVRPGM